MAKLFEDKNWGKIAEKIKRKYIYLQDKDLFYTPGKEEQQIQHLMTVLHKERGYVEFMLSKMNANADNNRL